MNRLRLAPLLLAAAMMTTLGACNNDDAGSSDPTVDGAVSEEAADEASGTENDEGAAASSSDDAAQSSPSTRRERSPFEDGQRRTVSFSDAAETLQFTAFEPTGLPKSATRTVVHALEPIEGIDNPLLPGMRMIYDLDGNGSVIITQGNAVGDIGDSGEEIEVDGVPARLVEDGESRVLVMEMGDAHIEVRSNTLNRETFLALVASLTPFDQIVEDEETEAEAPETDENAAESEGDTSDEDAASNDAAEETEEEGEADDSESETGSDG